MEPPVHYGFGNATFFPREGRLRVGEDDLILEQKVSDLLHAFCRRPGQVLTKSWLLEEIWPGRIVNEDSLSVAVSKLRRVLGDRAASPKYIRTITGTGYMWLPETRHVTDRPTLPYSAAGSRAGWWLSSGIVGLGLLVAALGGWWFSRDPGPVSSSEPAPATTADPELGQLLEQAGERLESESPETLRQAIAEFREVLEAQPDSAQAYLGIAEAKLMLSATRGFLDIELYVDEVHALLDRVLELDPDNDRAWLRKAELHFLADWDFQVAEHAFRRAIELGPEDPVNYLSYSEFLLTLGEFERSEEILQQLREADPAAYGFLNMSFVYTMRGELERALAETKRLMSSESDAESYGKMQQRIALLLGDEDLAFERLLAQMHLEDLSEDRIAEYTKRFRQDGLEALFGRMLDDRLEVNVGHYRPPIAWARYAVVAGRPDEAFRWLGEALDERQPQILLLNVDPHYLPLRNDPRFAELLHRLPQRAGDPKSSD